MNIMKLNRLFALVAVAVMTVGCYEKFETVAPREVYSDESFEQKFPDAVHITIAELKYAFGDISNTGVNSAWSNTKYKLIGEDIFVDEDVYIKGVVTSDDTEGNVYKSLYIQDETSGIELKLNNNVGIRYKKGTWVYVRLTGLYLGNYRMMLSLGGAPSESYNKAGEHKFYANSNIELQEVIDKHVFPGKPKDEGLKVGTFEEWQRYAPNVDIITVTPENYEEVFNPAKVELDGKFYGTEKTDANGITRKVFEISQRELMFGRLMRFEDLECHYAGVANQDGVTNPGLKSGSFENIYPSWLYSDHVLQCRRLGTTGHSRRMLQAVASMALYASHTTTMLQYALQMVSTHCARVDIHALHAATYVRTERRLQSQLSTAYTLRSLTTQATPMIMRHIS